MEQIESGKQYLHLFEGYGVELEYMIVDRNTLNIRSLADQVLAAVGGPWTREVQCGALAWSNELVLHVIELKTNGPARTLPGLYANFDADIRRINDLLSQWDACLLPTAMHPWIRPDDEAALWEQEDAEIYSAMDRIFSCQGHGWKNLQSAHLNLPFFDNAEFVQLHAAIRLVLPLIPAIAASSPFMDGADNGILDNRLMVYQGHCHRFPQAMGPVVPEPVDSIAGYHATILGPLYEALKPHDPEGILAYEWINARGAIARFDRQTIEIRLVDVQECPVADLAITRALVGAVQGLVGRDVNRQTPIPSEHLRAVLQDTIHYGQEARIDDAEYLSQLGMNTASATAGEVWRHLVERMADFDGAEREAMETILTHGPLAKRMRQVAHHATSGNPLPEVCRRLTACLAEGTMLLP
jgi:gamma-glutamyl:cysteine ligase YbdK (ATP-grasp superfamily)